MTAITDTIGDWARRAACVGHDTVDVPAEICDLCPVNLDCLAYALDAGIPNGTWGGFNPQGRAELLTAAGGHHGEALLHAHRVHRERRVRNLALARRLHPSRTRSAPT